ncbi:MAG TPA: DUF2207 domain-containing protein, partial [Acidimicrobiales bacterium]|nr:DUF2207 domain-containing protein [Acidimicrobiales bacterium]
MRTRSRRRLDVVLIGAGGLVLGGATAIAAFGYNEERIEQLWVGAAIQPDGTASLREVVDYQFGNTLDRHGLLRRIPGLTPQSPVAVSSPTGAPDAVDSMSPYTFDGGEQGVEIRVGDAARNVSGAHRYVLGYDLATLAEGEAIAWDAVGTGWEVPIEEAEVHLVAPWALEDLGCLQGPPRSEEPCEDELEQV